MISERSGPEDREGTSGVVRESKTSVCGQQYPQISPL
jgi:hypothetical protein